MTFTSRARIEVPLNVDAAFTRFNTLDTFKKIAHLAPNCLSVEIDHEKQETGTIHFVLHETASFLGMKFKIRVVGTQRTQDHTQIYESRLDSGFVTIHKTRTFTQSSDQKCLIEEEIRGSTAWYMRAYVQRECRCAHADQVSQYAKLCTS